ncbi:MAG: sugar phosphate isomerase/epimerase [Clostridia bacterium]|nr:sugar phosphate isomerase/epimerase [Clostridia bacterium]
MSNIKLGAQLYTLRDYIKTYEDCEETFKFLNSIGINVIQISGIGPIEPEKVAYLVDKYNMDVCCTHTSFDRMREDLDAVMKEHEMLHCDTLGIGGMPQQYRENAESIAEFIKITSEIGKRMHANGMQFAYHNHSFEFEKLDNGRRIMDTLIEDTKPEEFSFIADTYWMQYGGVNPCDYIEKIANRMKVCHFKDYKMVNNTPTFAEIGTGNLNLDAIYNTCKSSGVKYIVIEQDLCEIDPRDSMAISYKNLVDIAARNN